MRYAFSIFYIFLFFSFTSAQTEQKHSINFDFDSYEINIESEKQLKEILNHVSNSFDFSIDLIGHTDQDGDFEYNNILANKRAEAVFNYLRTKGTPVSKITFLSKGEYELLYPQNDVFSKAQNRRVEIIVKINELESVEDLISKLSPESKQQDFAISPTISQIITGKEGTVVEIPENTFVFKDGSSPKGPIKISLTEAFDFNAFMNHDLSCRSAGELLETGGMIKLTASSEGRELKIKEGKEVAFTYPKSNIKEGMELFYGKADEQGVSNWEVTGQKINLATPIVNEKILAEIDLKSLLLSLEKPKMPVFDLPPLPVKPRFPLKPHKPYEPIKPTKESIHLNLSFKEKIFFSQKKKDEMINAEFQKKLNIYKLQRTKYEEKLEAYAVKMDSYNEEVSKTKIKIKKWKEDIEDAKYDLSYYYEKLDVYKTSKIIYIAQKYLERNVNESDKYRILTNYDKLLYRKDFTIDNPEAKKYYHKLYGDKKYFHNRYIHDYTYNNQKEEIFDNSLEEQRDNNRKIRNAPLAMIAKANFALKKDKSIHDFGNYATSISSLGWINCDRFRKIKEEDKRELAFKVDQNTKIYLAFRDINSMLTPTRKGNEISFEGIPTGERITLVGIKLENKRPQVYYEELTVNGDEVFSPSFKASTIEEISAVFESLGS